jgi:hypothetical protein
MRRFLRSTLVALTAAFVLAGWAMPSDAVARNVRPAPSTAFDGLWSVSIITDNGDCSRAYRYPLRIINGQVLKADDDPNYNVGGAVARNGAIGVTVAGAGQSASGTGRLSRNYGRGIWRTATGECSGEWVAERRQ